MKKESAVSKGKTFEREIAKEIEERLGGRVWRTPSSGGQWWEKADIAGKGNILVERFHVEAKRQEICKWDEWYGQALRGAGTNKIPIVIGRKSRDVSMVYLKLDDFLTLLEELQNAQ